MGAMAKRAVKFPTKTCRVCHATWFIRVAEPKKCPRCKNVLVLPRKVSA